jgi:endonuclease/exonuclease/phosphatase family metal-dependent hydrolase
MTRLAASMVVAMYALSRLAGFVTEPRLTDNEIHRIAGEPARLAAPMYVPGSLRVVTWNIEQGRQFQQIVRTLQALEPDVVLLQEVDRGCERSGRRDVARELAYALGMNWVMVGEFQEIGEGGGRAPALTGQAILSRTRIDDPKVIVFRRQAAWRWRYNPTQPRRGGRVALRARTGGALVYNLHIESVGSDVLRQNQLQDVLADQTLMADDVVVVGGDFNTTVAGRASVLSTMAAAGFAHAPGTDHARTSINHRQPLDWIFLKGRGRRDGHVHSAPGISDHHPVVTTLTRQE